MVDCFQFSQKLTNSLNQKYETKALILIDLEKKIYIYMENKLPQTKLWKKTLRIRQM